MFKGKDENYLKLPGSYLFSTVGRKQREYSAAHPDKKVIRLSIGDVTQPLAPVYHRAPSQGCRRDGSCWRHSRDMLLISAMSSSETP